MSLFDTSFNTPMARTARGDAGGSTMHVAEMIGGRFPDPPAARDTDPATSHAAAALDHSAARERVHAALVSLGAACVSEVQAVMDEPPERGVIARRLNDLEAQGRAVRTGEHRVPVGGRSPQQVWRAA